MTYLISGDQHLRTRSSLNVLLIQMMSGMVFQANVIISLIT